MQDEVEDVFGSGEVQALCLTDLRALDTKLSQNAMRFHGRIAIDDSRFTPT
jgi:hypothetical protein